MIEGKAALTSLPQNAIKAKLRISSLPFVNITSSSSMLYKEHISLTSFVVSGSEYKFKEEAYSLSFLITSSQGG